MVPSEVSTRPVMPVSSATSRAAASSSVSSPSMCPLGRHHSTRPARLRRAMIAIRAVPPSTSTMTPPADTSSTAGSRRTCRDGFGTGELMCVTVTSGRVCPRRARGGWEGRGASPTLGSRVLLRPDQPAPAGGRTPAGPRPADPHRARCPLRRRRARALAGRRPGAGRVPRPHVTGPGLHHRRDARCRPRRCCAAGPTRTGTWAARSAPSARARTSAAACSWSR